MIHRAPKTSRRAIAERLPMTYTQAPLFDESCFNSNGQDLLQAAETAILEECCRNGCTHEADGDYIGGKVNNPTHCKFFKVSSGIPFECAAFDCGV